MFKSLDPRHVAGVPSQNRRSYITDDPLATIETTPRRPQPRFFSSTSTSSPVKEVYAVSRINPLYVEDGNELNRKNVQQIPNVHRPHHIQKRIHGHNALSDEEDDGEVYDGLASPPSSGDKSSGYVSQINSHSGSSHGGEDPIYSRAMSDSHDAYGRHPQGIYESQSSVPSPATLMLLQQNPGYVKSIKLHKKTARVNPNLHPGKGSMSSTSSASSASTTPGVLATIPEGEIDSSIPRPIWPHFTQSPKSPISISPHSTMTTSSVFDLSDDARNLKCVSEFCESGSACAKDILREISRTINEVVDGKNSDLTAEQMLHQLCLHIDRPNRNTKTDEDMRSLCLNLTANEKLNIVARALNHGQHATSTPYANSAANLLDMLNNSVTKELDSSPTASSTSSSVVFVHKDLASVSNGVRNAVMYSTNLCRNSGGGYGARDKLIEPSNQSKNDIVHHSSGPMQHNERHETADDKPSLWEIYYGTGIVAGDIRLKAKPTDTPSFPIGRPEADFTLDVPRAELLMRRMKADKKWRCRCRIFTSFMGLLFFLLTVMAVSLMLTRGKRMFGSML